MKIKNHAERSALTRRRFSTLTLAAGALVALIPVFNRSDGTSHNSEAHATSGGWKSAATGNTFGKPGVGTLPG